MVFGRDKKKESKGTKAAQYTQPPPPPALGNANLYPQAPPPSARSSSPYPPRAPPNQAYDPRFQGSSSRPSGPIYAQAPQPRPPPPSAPYSSPMPYRPARQQQQPRAGVLKEVASPPVMMPGMRCSRPTGPLFSKKVYEMKARRAAWDRGLEEYFYARDNRLPYAGNPEYGDYVCRAPDSRRPDYQTQGGNGGRHH